VSNEGSGKVVNTIPPNDFSFYEMLNAIVQQEPAMSLDPKFMGPLAAVGIIKGKPFAPDARMKKILTETLALANAISRLLLMVRDPVPLQPARTLLHETVAAERDRFGS
jgi:hypothetical protein